MLDLQKNDDDVETIVVCSGGGSRGFWQWLVLMALANRFKISLICGTSAGALNAYGFGKGSLTQKYVTETYHRVFAENVAPISGPGLAEFKKGKLSFSLANIKKYLLKGINFWDVFRLPFKKQQEKLLKQLADNVLSAPSLLDNSPLYERIREIQAINPAWEIPTYWNRVDMRDGPLSECGWDDQTTSEDEVKSVVASTTIPLLWPLVDGRWADGGLREGIPLGQAFNRLDPKKKYRIINIECSSDDLPEGASLSNPVELIAQMVAIQMNESRRNDKKGILDKNQEALEKGEAYGRVYLPIYSIQCSSLKSSLDFSPEAKEDFAECAANDVNLFFTKYNQAI